MSCRKVKINKTIILLRERQIDKLTLRDLKMVFLTIIAKIFQFVKLEHSCAGRILRESGRKEREFKQLRKNPVWGCRVVVRRITSGDAPANR